MVPLWVEYDNQVAVACHPQSSWLFNHGYRPPAGIDTLSNATLIFSTDWIGTMAAMVPPVGPGCPSSPVGPGVPVAPGGPAGPVSPLQANSSAVAQSKANVVKRGANGRLISIPCQ